jgi:hypothetical protein
MTQLLTLGRSNELTCPTAELSMNRRSIRPEGEKCRGLQGVPEPACICGREQQTMFSNFCPRAELVPEWMTSGERQGE